MGSARLTVMDERAIKRLLIILAVSLVAIFLFKSMMTSTIVNLNKAAAEKKVAARPPVAQPEVPAVSDAAVVTTPESSAASGANGAQ